MVYPTALGAALALASCGSTVQMQGRYTAHQGAGFAGDLAPGDPATAGQEVPAAPVTGVRGAGMARGSGGPSGGPAGGDAGSPSGAATGSGNTPLSGEPSSRGPTGGALGVNDKTIKIGIYTLTGFDTAARNLGISVATGDQAQMARAVIKYVNQHGGTAGRQMVPVIHDADVSTTTSNPAAEYEAACKAWTEDNRVYALVTPIGTTGDGLYSCLSKRHVIAAAAGEVKDARFFQRYSEYFYMPAEINLTRTLSTNVDALFEAGWFGTRSKVGLLRNDTNEDLFAKQDGLSPALARHGLKLHDEFALSQGSSQSSEYSSAVLRFKTEGITRVIFSTNTGILGFAAAAEAQGYRPLYALNSRSSPAALLQGNVPKEQLHGSMGIGWQPMNDVDGQHDPGKLSDRQALCLRLIRDAGQDTSVRATALVGLWICDAILFLHDAIEHAPNFTPAGFRAGAESLRGNHAASTFVSSFVPGRLHDAARAYRLFAFDDPCQCFRYVTRSRDLR